MKILSKRVIAKTQTNKKRHCFDIIFEWEDIIAESTGCDIICRSNLEFKFDEICRKIYKRTHIPVYRLFDLMDIFRGQDILMFDASSKKSDGIYNSKRYIPIVIDYFANEEGYKLFVNAYRRNKMVFVTNKDVYDYLKKRGCPIQIEYYTLSLPDCCKMQEGVVKKYDFIVAGRTNPLLLEYLDKYERAHPEAIIVRRKYEDDHFVYYLSSTGETIEYGDTRENYMQLLGETKIALYTTPGMDGTRPDANGWNQVTPRFLEEISAQCHILARFPDNADTRTYEMNKICHCVQNYEDFEATAREYLKQPVDTEKYREYLSEHYTSATLEQLKSTLRENKIL